MRKILASIIILTGLTACNENRPAAFWRTFEPELLDKEDAYDIPNGGRQTFHWSTSELNRFNPDSVLAFAIKNGWEPTDTIEFSRKEMNDWESDDMLLFPFYFNGTIKMYSQEDSIPHPWTSFERFIDEDLTIYICRTDTLLVSPGGPAESTFVNSFILLNSDGTQLTTYNLWGE